MSKLRAGAAKICIDPSPDMFPIPHVWGVAYEDIYASIYIRALAVANVTETLVFASFDAGNGDDDLKAVVTERYGVPAKNILFCSTHNHGGPHSGKKPSPLSMPGSARILEQLGLELREKTIEVVGQAIQNMRPARFGFGEGPSFINVNRDLQLEDGSWAQADNWEGHSDKTLAVMKFVDEEGKLIAAILNHGTHANTTFLGKDVDGKTKTCGDFPGFTCDFLEKRYGNNAIILWTSGAAGNQNAIQAYRGDRHYIGEETVNYPDPNGMSYRYAEYLGEIHAFDAEKVLKKIDCDKESVQLSTALTDVTFERQVLPAGVNASLNILKAQNAVRTIKRLFPDAIKEGEPVNRGLVECVPTGERIPCEMQLFVLGDVAIITSPAELYSELGTLCKEQSPLRKTFVITNASGHGNKVGYVQDDASSTHPVFQHFSDVRPGNNNAIVLDGVKKLFDEVMS